MNIVEYVRPKTIEDAIGQLKRDDLKIIPMGGGSWITLSDGGPVGVLDLQDLELGNIEKKGKLIEIGAGVTLQDITRNSLIPESIRSAVSTEFSYNSRHQGTLAGAIVTTTGRSLLGSVLLAVDAKLTIEPGSESIQIGEFFPLRPTHLHQKLITFVGIPTNTRVALDYVARTTHDLPILIAAVARWGSGRTRVVVGGYGAVPLLVMDGSDETGAATAAVDGYHEAEDEWASAQYRRETIAVLVERCLKKVTS